MADEGIRSSAAAAINDYPLGGRSATRKPTKSVRASEVRRMLIGRELFSETM
jgi:hypothetical protein